MEKIYDVLIIGGGPAGMSAGIYAKRAGREVAIIEKYAPGGQVGLIGEIENYLGFEKVDGFELSNKFFKHASSLGVEFKFEEVVGLNVSEQVKEIICKKNIYKAYTIILAMGCHTKELNIDGEKEFKGKGVSYCAICDGNFFKGKDVAVVGSGDAAFSDVDYLQTICNRVFLLTKENLNLSNYTPNEFDGKENVTLLKGASSKTIIGENKVQALSYVMDGNEKKLDVDAVFIAIGRTPDTQMLNGKIEMNEKGYVKVDASFKTNVEGVYACGDICVGSIRQIATAVGDGAVAGTNASKIATKIITLARLASKGRV